LEHWNAFKSTQAAGKKKVKTVAAAIVHPRRDKEQEQTPTEDVHEQVSTEPITKPSVEKPADKALRARAEQIRRKSQHDDERWRSGSQWRWEVITGRAQKRMQEDEAKWKRAMMPAKEDGDAITEQQSARSPIQEEDTTANNSSVQNEATHQLDNTTASVENHTPGERTTTPQERPPAYTHGDNAEPSKEKAPNV
jgi:hypothetical protein